MLSNGLLEHGSMDIDEDTAFSLALRVKVSVTVWDFTLPITPSLPAVFGVSFNCPFLVTPNIFAARRLFLNLESGIGDSDRRSFWLGA